MTLIYHTVQLFKFVRYVDHNYRVQPSPSRPSQPIRMPETSLYSLLAGPVYWEHLTNPDSIYSHRGKRQVALTILSSSRLPNIQNWYIEVKIEENI